MALTQIALTALLALAVGAAWLAALALVRLAPLARLHAVTFTNVSAGGAVTLATWLSDGATPRTAKVTLIWLVLLLSGALGAHVAGRAIHLRSGKRR